MSLPISLGLGFSDATSTASSAQVANNAQIVFSSPGAVFYPGEQNQSVPTTQTTAASGYGGLSTPGATTGTTSGSGGMLLLLVGIAAAGGLGLWFLLKHHKK